MWFKKSVFYKKPKTGVKKILVLCPSPEGLNPAQRCKYEQYFAYLRSNGYKITISSFQTKRFKKIIYAKGRVFEKLFWVMVGYLRRVIDLLRIPFYDGLYIFLWVTPLGPPFFECITSWLCKRIVFDIDDMVFLNDDLRGVSKANRFVARVKGKSKPLFLMKKSKYVIVCTEKLVEIASKYNRFIENIPATFFPDKIIPVSSYPQNKVVTIGWTGSHSTQQFLHLLDEPLKEVARKRRIKLLVISDFYEDFKLEGVDVEFVRWSLGREVEDLRRIEIGLYPIPEEEWSLGKSGFKALNYMSVGVPVVATAYGENLKVISDGVTGFLASAKSEWVNAIVRLIDDSELRGRMGRAGRKRLENFYSFENNKDKYLKVFNEVYIR